ncbi:hypothetical protein PRIPAC_88312 [Pristionchus pacificus]|uniref:Uncharacterized protein n=1 Tax=Pristionchus pacificus TaxID=54126 RepID=A0A2A6CVY1_PRIPA|nr:hypothetical protein PRIPAC_88312 [Pristionchus pacificus]|eukprot:PDM82236.1 hypothetical protein PRIPAC_36629 [Pristionchus pacificus]
MHASDEDTSQSSPLLLPTALRTVRRYVGNDGQITATHCDVEVIVSALAAQIIKKLAEKAIEKAGAEILGSGLGALAMAAGLKGHRDVHTIDELYMKMEKTCLQTSSQILRKIQELEANNNYRHFKTVGEIISL